MRQPAPDDDGRTIAPMDVPGMPGHRTAARRHKGETPDRLSLTRAERRALVKGALLAFLPPVAVVGAAFLGLLLLLDLVWLR